MAWLRSPPNPQRRSPARLLLLRRSQLPKLSLRPLPQMTIKPRKTSLWRRRPKLRMRPSQLSLRLRQPRPRLSQLRLKPKKSQQLLKSRLQRRQRPLPSQKEP